MSASDKINQAETDDLQLLPFPYPDKPTDAVEYIYFWRCWGDGTGNDVAIWSRLPDGSCQYGCYVTGETTVSVPMRILAERPIVQKKFAAITQTAVKLGIAEIPSQAHSIVLTHYDDICGICLRDGTQHQYFVRCGRHIDPRDSQVKKHLLSYSRELVAHFKAEVRMQKSFGGLWPD